MKNDFIPLWKKWGLLINISETLVRTLRSAAYKLRRKSDSFNPHYLCSLIKPGLSYCQIWTHLRLHQGNSIFPVWIIAPYTTRWHAKISSSSASDFACSPPLHLLSLSLFTHPAVWHLWGAATTVRMMAFFYDESFIFLIESTVRWSLFSKLHQFEFE